MQPTFPWKRFWCPRGEDIGVEDGGYLTDPDDSNRGRANNPKVLSNDQVAHVPCLVLLGEPGMGKSTAVQEMKAKAEAETDTNGSCALTVDLRAYQTDLGIAEAIFGSPAFSGWLAGAGHLHLFLDSLDECLLRVDSVAAFLAVELRKLPAHRLSLRVACRTADWPSTLEDALFDLWGKSGVSVLEILPLRRTDVATASEVMQLDPRAFLREVHRVEVVPLAVKPVTLKFLLNLFDRHSRLPRTQAELYAEGCRLLCEEVNRGRRESKRTGVLNAGRRLAIAARIAAITVFGNRYAVWTALEQGNVPPADVPISSLVGGTEFADGAAFEVDEAAIQDTLSYSGLFSLRGADRMGWTHQTYAEFLAAKYVNDRGLTVRQIRSLIFHPEEPGRLVPQLHEVGGWLAASSGEIFNELLPGAADILLQSDLATRSDADRAALVDAFLLLEARDQIIHPGLFVRPRFDKLSYPGLADQLRPYIFDRLRPRDVRRTAIAIADACSVNHLGDELANLALDTSEDLIVRDYAAMAVSFLPNKVAQLKLKPLIAADPTTDPDEDLKGWALRTLWPHAVTAEELFPSLSMPRRRHAPGPYRTFFERNLTQGLKLEDLPLALRWVARTAVPYDSVFRELIDDIMRKGWSRADDAGIAEAFAEAAWSRVTRYEALIEGDSTAFGAELASHDERRRKIVAAMIRFASDKALDPTNLLFNKTSFFGPRDVPWLLEQVEKERSTEYQKAWIKLVARGIWWPSGAILDAVLHTGARVPALAQAMQDQLSAIELSSAKAEELREGLRERKMREGRRAQAPLLLVPSPVERVSAKLDSFDAGDNDCWWEALLDMTLESHSTHHIRSFEWDLTEFPVWKIADAELRRRIVTAAESYLQRFDPEPLDWIETRLHDERVVAGYRALCLLYREGRPGLERLSSAVWKRWAPIVLGYSAHDLNDKADVHSFLVSQALRHASEELRIALRRLIELENNEGDYLSVLQKLEHSWDEQLEEVVLKAATEPSIKPRCVGALLQPLLRRSVKSAMQFALTLLERKDSSTVVDREKAVIAGRELIALSEDRGWSTVWPVMFADHDFGRKVALAVVQNVPRGDLQKREPAWDENDTASIFIFLATAFPYSEDSRSEHGSSGGVRGIVAQWRDLTLQSLRDAGTVAACRALERVQRELPHLVFLERQLFLARLNARRRTWIPPRPRDILALVRDKRACLVTNVDDLFLAVIDSLRRLEARLHGETPAAIDLWDRMLNDTFRPKKENELSNYVKRHLEDDLRVRGVVVNREVEIRDGVGATPGQRTDIRVDAVVTKAENTEYDKLSLIIETKGGWNKDLKTGMKGQLIERYLRENDCRNGLYLVGWFNCASWDRSDTRWKKATKWAIEKARTFFVEQAAGLTQPSLTIRSYVLDTALR